MRLTQKKSAAALFFILPMSALVMAVFWRVDISIEAPRRQVWQGYDLVLVDRESVEDLSTVERIFTAAGCEDVLTERSQNVYLFNYPEVEIFSFSELDSFLSPQDMRNDPYLRGLNRYFHGRYGGGEAHVVYIKEGQDEDLQGALEMMESRGINYARPENSRGGSSFYWLPLALTMMALTLYMPASARLLFLAGGVLLFVGYPVMDFVLFGTLVLNLMGWALLSGWYAPALKQHFNIGIDGLSRGVVQRLSFYLIILILSGTFLFIGIEGFFPIFASLLDTLVIHGALLVLFAYLSEIRVRKQDHTLFFPVSLLGAERYKARAVRLGVLLFALTFALPLGFLLLYPQSDGFEKQGGSLEYPYPVSLVGDGADELTWENMLEAASNDDSKLPNLIDYVTHRAYQETFFYGRPYGLPVPREEVFLPVFERVGNQVITKNRRVKLFTDKWYADIIEAASEGGVPALLLAQGSLVAVENGEVKPSRLSARLVWAYVGLCALIVPLVVYMSMRNGNVKNISIQKLQQRKGQKVA